MILRQKNVFIITIWAQKNNEIEVRGKNMGAKRGSGIDINDVVIPKKQIMLI